MKLIPVKQVLIKQVRGPKGDRGPIGPVGLPGKAGPVGPKGADGKDGEVKQVTVVQYETEQLEVLKRDIEKLKKRRAEVSGGGSTPTHYLWTDAQETHYRKPSFVLGITIIGVRYSGAATVYLPHDLDPTMIVAVKDEAGSGNVTVLVE